MWRVHVLGDVAWHVAGDVSDYVAADVASDVDVHVSTFYWATGHAMSSPRVLL